jgi:hypothetical protein
MAEPALSLHAVKLLFEQFRIRGMSLRTAAAPLELGGSAHASTVENRK